MENGDVGELMLSRWRVDAQPLASLRSIILLGMYRGPTATFPIAAGAGILRFPKSQLWSLAAVGAPTERG